MTWLKFYQTWRVADFFPGWSVSVIEHHNWWTRTRKRREQAGTDRKCHVQVETCSRWSNHGVESQIRQPTWIKPRHWPRNWLEQERHWRSELLQYCTVIIIVAKNILKTCPPQQTKVRPIEAALKHQRAYLWEFSSTERYWARENLNKFTESRAPNYIG